MDLSFFDYFALTPAGYTLAIDLCCRLMGAMFLIVYVPFLFQVRGLFGREGIRPIADYLKLVKTRTGRRRFYYVPSLLWINSSDAALFALLITGIVLGTLVLLGFYPSLFLFLLYILHLSLNSAAQDFLNFGWETLLMEISFGLALVTATAPYNLIGWLGLNVLLFRLYLQAGASKLISRDPNWRNLTALSYHYFTQPLPNTTAWYIQKWPMWFHKTSALFMYFTELFVPFFMFSPPAARFTVFLLMAGLQVGIWLTGNFSFLNYLTFVFCTILIPNVLLHPFLSEPSSAPSPLLWQGFISIVALGYLALQVACTFEMFYPQAFFQKWLRWLRPFHLAYPHGIFAIMTTRRYEPIIEGSEDGKVWHEYEFYYKPGDVDYRPRRIAPWQPRLDWQMWFLPFGEYKKQEWFQMFLLRILQGSPPVLKMLKTNPFPDEPPVYLRVLFYDYTFTSYEEREQTGHWWKRKLVGEYAPPMHLATKKG